MTEEERAKILECEHDWKEAVDSQFSNEHETDVKCIRCGVAGSRNEKTGDVYWPAT